MKTPYEQLDLSIPNMDSHEAEGSARTILESVSGVHAVRLIERGAWIEYDPSTVNHHQIVSALHHAGIRASLFQDSATGATGVSKV